MSNELEWVTWPWGWPFQSERSALNLKGRWNRGRPGECGTVAPAETTGYFCSTPSVEPGGSLAGNDSFDASSTTSRGSIVSITSDGGTVGSRIRVRRRTGAARAAPCSLSLLMRNVPFPLQSDRSSTSPIDSVLIADKKPEVLQKSDRGTFRRSRATASSASARGARWRAGVRDPSDRFAAPVRAGAMVPASIAGRTSLRGGTDD